MLTASFTIEPDAPFSLSEAANFGFGPQMARPKPSESGMALAFTVDGFASQAGVFLRQDEAGVVTGTVFGDADPDAVRLQAARVVSLDAPASGWIEAGVRDPVLGGLQSRFPGLRPVLFYSPYEAAAWAMLTQRRQRSQSAVVRRKLSEQHGMVFDLPDGPLAAFPRPEQLLAVTDFPGIDAERIERLHGVARAALDGLLEPDELLALEPSEAMARLQGIKGIGPMYAGLILLRSTGARDIATLDEPRLPGYVGHYYHLGRAAERGELQAVAEGWRPFRTWAGVLIRTAGDRDGLPG